MSDERQRALRLIREGLTLLRCEWIATLSDDELTDTVTRLQRLTEPPVFSLSNTPISLQLSTAPFSLSIVGDFDPSRYLVPAGPPIRLSGGVDLTVTGGERSFYSDNWL